MPLGDPDIWLAAKAMLDRDGEKALDRAARFANKLRASGDTEGWWTWARICRAILMRLLADPAEGEPHQ